MGGIRHKNVEREKEIFSPKPKGKLSLVEPLNSYLEWFLSTSIDCLVYLLFHFLVFDRFGCKSSQKRERKSISRKNLSTEAKGLVASY